MLQFMAPMWLWLLPAMLALGLMFLLRQSSRGAVVPTIYFWTPDVAASAAARGRRIDPLWALLLAAALVAALAAAQPQWKPSAATVKPTLAARLAMARAPGSKTAELFLRERPQAPGASAGAAPQCHLRLESAPGRKPPWRRQFLLPKKFWRVGTVVAGLPAARRMRATLMAPGYAHETFLLTRKTRPAFALLSIGRPGRFLLRAFSVQPGAAVDNLRLRPRIVLVDRRRFSLSSAGHPAAVVASGRTPLPGLAFSGGQPVRLTKGISPQKTGGAGALRAVHFRHVAVRRYWNVIPDKHWRVLAAVAGHPWLLERSASPAPSRGGATLYYIGSKLSTHWTNLARRSALVILAANMVRRARAAPNGGSGGRTVGIQTWTTRQIPRRKHAATAKRPVSLAVALLLTAGLLATLFLVLAATRG